MASRKVLILTLLSLNSICYSQASQNRRLPKVDLLTRPVKEYQDAAYDLSTALVDLSQRHAIPIGIDAAGPLTHHPFSVSIGQGTVSDALNAIVGQEPSYEWRETQHGIVNVFPREHPTTILDVRIHSFRLKNGDSSDIQTAIASQPEVKQWLKDNRLTEKTPTAVDIIVGKDGYVAPRVSLNLHDLTLREILNMVLKSNNKFHSWLVGRWGERDQYLSVAVY